MDTDTKFDLILGELKNICKQIDDKFEQVDEKFDQIDKRFEQVDRRLDSLSLEVGALHRTLFKNDLLDNTTFRVSVLEDNAVNS